MKTNGLDSYDQIPKSEKKKLYDAMCKEFGLDSKSGYKESGTRDARKNRYESQKMIRKEQGGPPS